MQTIYTLPRVACCEMGGHINKTDRQIDMEQINSIKIKEKENSLNIVWLLVPQLYHFSRGLWNMIAICKF